MILIVVGTNRVNGLSYQVADIVTEILKQKKVASEQLKLIDLPNYFLFTALYDQQGKNEKFNSYQKKIDDYSKIIFIIPEYNGSYPGILKSFVDGLVYPHSLRNKIVGMIGISAGSLGGAIAISHFTDVLHYMGAIVLPITPRIAFVHRSIEANGRFTPEVINTLIDQLLIQMIETNK
jgi:NAD(P)H-dependent FMN reductase